MRYISATETAKLLRDALRKRFPELPLRFFSVKTDTRAGGASIEVAWVDGPSEREVKPILLLFSGAAIDGASRTKHYEGEEVHFGAEYVVARRLVTEKLVRPFVTAFQKTFAPYADPIEVRVSPFDYHAYVDHNSRFDQDIERLLTECSEGDLAHLELTYAQGTYAIVRDVEAAAIATEHKSGMLTKYGARALGCDVLAGEQVSYYESTDASGTVWAETITHPRLAPHACRLEIGDIGITSMPACLGLLTGPGAERIYASGVAWNVVRYDETSVDGVPTAEHIYLRGDRLKGQVPIGYEGILPRHIGRSFYWAGQNVNLAIIQQVKRMYQRDWEDGIEITIVDERGEETTSLEFAWYDVDGEAHMKVEVACEHFDFLDAYPQLFRLLKAMGPRPAPILVADLLERDFGFTRRNYA